MPARQAWSKECRGTRTAIMEEVRGKFRISRKSEHIIGDNLITSLPALEGRTKIEKKSQDLDVQGSLESYVLIIFIYYFIGLIFVAEIKEVFCYF